MTSRAVLIASCGLAWESEGSPYRPPRDFVRGTDKTHELIMYRDAASRFQIEQIVIYAGSIVPAHNHPRTSALEAAVSGLGEFTVAGVTQYAFRRKYEGLLARTVFIDRGVMHEGRAITDFMYLSFQLWDDGVEMGFITDDWDGPPL